MTPPNPRSSALLGATLLGVVLGLGLGLALSPAGSDAGSRGTTSLAPGQASSWAATPTAAGPRGASTSPPSLVEANFTPAEVRATAEAGVSSRAIERAAAVAVTAIEARRGQARLSGVVLDLEGQPVPDVLVVARPRARSTPNGSAYSSTPPTDGRDLSALLRETASEWSGRHAGGGRTSSNKQGRFELTELTGEAFTVEAFCTGWKIQVAAGGAARAGQELRLAATPLQSVTLDLRMPDGTEVQSARLKLRGMSEETEVSWTRAAPEIYWAEPEVLVRAYAGLLDGLASFRGIPARYRSDEKRIELEEQGQIPFRLELQSRGGIRGMVVDPWGGGLRPNVTYMLLSGSSAPDLEALAEQRARSSPWDGEFFFDGLAPGRYAVGVYLHKGQLLDHRVVTVDEGFVEATLELPEPDSQSHLAVQALSPLGAPLYGLTYRIRKKGVSDSKNVGLVPRYDRDGLAWLDLRPLLGEELTPPPGGELELTAQHATFGMRTETLSATTRRLTLVFEQGARLNARISGYEGHAHADQFSLRLRGQGLTLDSSTGRRARARMASDGSTVYRNLAPGDYTLELRMGSSWDARTIHSVKVSVAGEATEAVVVAPVLHEVTVEVPGVPRRTSVTLRALNPVPGIDSSNSSYVDNKGKARFNRLASGPYEISVRGAEEPMRIEVPCPPVEFRGRFADCARVSISSTQGELYQAGLRAGDLIVAVDGQRFPLTGGTSFLTNALKNRVQLTVERDNGSFDLPLGPLTWGSGASRRHGGSFVADYR